MRSRPFTQWQQQFAWKLVARVGQEYCKRYNKTSNKEATAAVWVEVSSFWLDHPDFYIVIRIQNSNYIFFLFIVHTWMKIRVRCLFMPSFVGHFIFVGCFYLVAIVIHLVWDIYNTYYVFIVESLLLPLHHHSHRCLWEQEFTYSHTFLFS